MDYYFTSHKDIEECNHAQLPDSRKLYKKIKWDCARLEVYDWPHPAIIWLVQSSLYCGLLVELSMLCVLLQCCTLNDDGD